MLVVEVNVGKGSDTAGHGVEVVPGYFLMMTARCAALAAAVAHQVVTEKVTVEHMHATFRLLLLDSPFAKMHAPRLAQALVTTQNLPALPAPKATHFPQRTLFHNCVTSRSEGFTTQCRPRGL